MEEKKELIKFTYLVDPDCTDRTVCIARKVIGNHIYLSYSLNRSVMLDSETRPILKNKIDQKLFSGTRKRDKDKTLFVLEKFSKPKAREVSIKRLTDSPIIINRVDGEPPIRTTMKYVVAGSELPKKIQEICMRSIASLESKKIMKETLKNIF